MLVAIYALSAALRTSDARACSVSGAQMISAVCPQFAPDGARLALGSMPPDILCRADREHEWVEISIVSAVTGQLECTLGPFWCPMFAWARDARRLMILESGSSHERLMSTDLSIACALSGTVLRSDTLGTEPTYPDPDCFSPCGRYALLREWDESRMVCSKARVIDTASRLSVWQLDLPDVHDRLNTWRHAWHPHDSVMAFFDHAAFAAKVVSLADGVTLVNLGLEPAVQRMATGPQLPACRVNVDSVLYMGAVLLCTLSRPCWRHCSPDYAVAAIDADSQQVSVTYLVRPDGYWKLQCAPTASLFAVSVIEDFSGPVVRCSIYDAETLRVCFTTVADMPKGAFRAWQAAWAPDSRWVILYLYGTAVERVPVVCATTWQTTAWIDIDASTGGFVSGVRWCPDGCSVLLHFSESHRVQIFRFVS